MALSMEDCTQQQQVYSTDCMNPTFFARRQQLSPPTPLLPLPPLFPLTPAENVESLPPHHDNESFDDSPSTLLSHKPLRGGHHYRHFPIVEGIHGYPSPSSTSANHSTTTTNLDDTPYDLFYDYPYPPLKQSTAALFGGYHVSGFPSGIDTIMTSTPSSMAVSTPSLSPSSPLSVFNDQQSPPPPPPPYPAEAPRSVRAHGENRLDLLSEEDADALLSPLSPEWGTTALTATNTAAAAARHGILGLPTHHQNIEQPHHLPTSTLLPPSSTLSPLNSPSQPLGDFDELLVSIGSDRRGSQYHEQPDDLWDNVGEEDDDDGFPPFLNLSIFDAAHDDLMSASTSASTARPILPLLDIPLPRSGATTAATRSRASSRSRSRSPLWEYPPLPRSSTPSVLGVRDHGDDIDEDDDVDRVGGEDDAHIPLDGQDEDSEFIVSPPSSGPPDTPSTPTDLPVLPFLSLFDDDDEDGEDFIPISQKRRTQHDTEDVVSIPGYFPHPTSPSIAVHPSIPPPFEHEDQHRDLVQQLQLRDSPRSRPESPNSRKEEDWLHYPPSPSAAFLSLPPPLAPLSSSTSPLLLPHASPRPALLQLSFEDEGDFGLGELSGVASPPFSPDNNGLRLLLHNSPPRSPPHPSTGPTAVSSSATSPTRSPSPEFYDNLLMDLGVEQVGEYAEEVKKLVELQKRALEAERVAREREGLVMAALQARRGVRLAASTFSSDASSSTPPASDKPTASLLESASTMSEDDQKAQETEEMVILQRAAVEARSVARRERERAKEVGMLLKLKLGEVLSEERENDTRMDTEDTTTPTTIIENAKDTDTPAPQLVMSSRTSPLPESASTSTLPLSSESTPTPPPTPTTAITTIPPKTSSHPRMASIAQLVAKMFLSRHEASPSSTSISIPTLPPPPTAISPPSTTTEVTVTSSSSAPSSASTGPSPVSSILRSSSSPSPGSSSKYRNLWLKGLAGSSMIGRLGGNDRFLQSQLQQRYQFLRSSPLARNASSIDDDDNDGGPDGADERDREERDIGGGFEALRRPIMWGMDLGEDEGVGLLPAL